MISFIIAIAVLSFMMGAFDAEEAQTVSHYNDGKRSELVAQASPALANHSDIKLEKSKATKDQIFKNLLESKNNVHRARVTAYDNPKVRNIYEYLKDHEIFENMQQTYPSIWEKVLEKNPHIAQSEVALKKNSSNVLSYNHAIILLGKNDCSDTAQLDSMMKAVDEFIPYRSFEVSGVGYVGSLSDGANTYKININIENKPVLVLHNKVKKTNTILAQGYEPLTKIAKKLYQEEQKLLKADTTA